MYSENKTGPKTEPWGTPLSREALFDLKDPKLTENDRSVKYDRNQLSAVPLIPAHDSRRERRIEWSTVSNAAVRSKSTSTDGLPESEIKRRSLNIFSNAVSVLCEDLKPDWNFSKISFELRCNLS